MSAPRAPSSSTSHARSKAPRIRAVSGGLTGRARDEGCDYEAYLVAVLAEELSARRRRSSSPWLVLPAPLADRVQQQDVQRLGQDLRDPVAVAAMVDRLVQHAEVIVLKGESFRLRGKREEVLSGEKERSPAQISIGVFCLGRRRLTALSRQVAYPRHH